MNLSAGVGFLRCLLGVLVAAALVGCTSPPVEGVDHPLPPKYVDSWVAKFGMSFTSKVAGTPSATCYALRGPLCVTETFSTTWRGAVLQVENLTFPNPVEAEAGWLAQRPRLHPTIMQVRDGTEWAAPWVAVDLANGEAQGLDCRDMSCMSWVWVAHKDRNVRGLSAITSCTAPCEVRLPLEEFRVLVEPLRLDA